MSGGDKRVFVDTNVLIYAVDPLDREKHERAAQWMSALWKPDAGRISWQVLNEFYFTAIRKSRMPAANARSVIESLAVWNPIGMGFGIVHRAWHWMDHANLSYWDALILASAETTGADFLLTEDFQTGRGFGRVTVVSPFDKAPSELGYSPASRA
jgi:predicted nucleic acid-binding protein